MSISKTKPRMVVLAMLSAIGAAHADERDSAMTKGFYYTEIRAGANFLDKAANSANASPLFGAAVDFDTGVSAGVAIGRSLTDLSLFPAGLRRLRVEAEYSYGSSDFEKAGAGNAELKSSVFMTNLYYDLPLAAGLERIKPYVGAGIGAVRIDAEGAGLADSDETVFAFQVRAGLAYAVRPDLNMTVGYRFLQTDDPKFDNTFESEYRSHAVEVGLRYQF